VSGTRRRRLVSWLIVSSVAGGLAAAGPAPALTDDGQVVVALVDSGINAAHQEFAPDQLVGYYDFSDGGTPKPGEDWDPDTAPSDPAGHGTGTASMVGARGVSAEQTPAAAPGVKLAMARVAGRDGAIAGDLAAAVRWATTTVRADVVNISIGAIVPVPADVQRDTYAALHEARAAGVLVTVSNGNGIGNTGTTPGDGASTPNSSSLDVLAVGASGADGALVSYNPHVTAQHEVRVPANDATTTYEDMRGTSFGSPFVGGFAARLVQELYASRRTMSVADLQRFVQRAARDTSMPPIFEGYGIVDLAALPGALGHIRLGTMPARPDPDDSATYVQTVAQALRAVNNGQAPGGHEDPGARALVAGGRVAPPGSGPGAGFGGTGGGATAVRRAARPRLRALRIVGRGGARRVRVLIDQRVTLRVTVTRGGRQVLSRTVRRRGPGAVTVLLRRRLSPGRHVVRVRATSEVGAGTATLQRRFVVR
jgi:hypothetical protein